jgi:hypothetical protein
MSKNKNYVREEARKYSEALNCTCFVMRDLDNQYCILCYDGEHIHQYLRDNYFGFKVCEIWETGKLVQPRGWKVA